MNTTTAKKSDKIELISFETLIEEKYGKLGTASREKFEADTLAFRLGINAQTSTNLRMRHNARGTMPTAQALKLTKLHLSHRKRT